MIPKNEDLKPISILLVESNVEHVNVFLQLAELNGWAVSTCQGSMEAIQWIKNNEAPDLMIIEKNASPLDGFQTHSYLQSELKVNIPVLISNEKDTVKEKNDNVLINFVAKPFTKKSVSTVNSLLKKPQLSTVIHTKEYSLDYLKSLSDDDEEFILKSLTIFRDSIPLKLIELRNALSMKEYGTVREIAHNIKPSFEMIGSTEGKDLCNTLVYKSDESEFPSVLSQLRQLFATIDVQLKNDITNFAQV